MTKIFSVFYGDGDKNFFTVTVTVTVMRIFVPGDGEKKHDYTVFFTGAGYVSPLVPENESKSYSNRSESSIAPTPFQFAHVRPKKHTEEK